MLDRKPEPLTPKARRTRAALLDATRQIVGETGVAAATVQAICARAGIGRTSYYNYFDDAPAAVAEVAEAAGQEIRTAFDALHGAQPRGLDRLATCLEMILTIARDDPPRALLLTALAQSDDTLPNMLTAEIAAELTGAGLTARPIAPFIALSTLALSRRIAEGKLTADLPALTALLMAPCRR
jgi:AcrR family transcriptional regulator